MVTVACYRFVGRMTGKTEVTCFEWEPWFVRTEWAWFT